MKDDATINDAIRTSLKAMAVMLDQAAKDAHKASGYMTRNQRNSAIGTIIPTNDALEGATGLYKAVLHLHRYGR